MEFIASIFIRMFSLFVLSHTIAWKITFFIHAPEGVLLKVGPLILLTPGPIPRMCARRPNVAQCCVQYYIAGRVLSTLEDLNLYQSHDTHCLPHKGSRFSYFF